MTFSALLQGACGDTPLALSFWLAANLPLDDAARQRLLEAHSAAERLYHAVRIMQALQLLCRECDAEVSHETSGHHAFDFKRLYHTMKIMQALRVPRVRC